MTDARLEVRDLTLAVAVRTRLPGRLNVFVLHNVNLALRFAGHGILLFGDGEARHGRLTEIVDRETLERGYTAAGCANGATAGGILFSGVTATRLGVYT